MYLYVCIYIHTHIHAYNLQNCTQVNYKHTKHKNHSFNWITKFKSLFSITNFYTMFSYIHAIAYRAKFSWSPVSLSFFPILYLRKQQEKKEKKTAVTEFT